MTLDFAALAEDDQWAQSMWTEPPAPQPAPTTSVEEALLELRRVGAAERAAHEEGRTFGAYQVEQAFDAAWIAGASRAEAETAYRLGLDWGEPLID